MSRVSVTVPIWLSLIRIALATCFSMPIVSRLGLGDEEVIADQLNFLADSVCEFLPRVPIVFMATVFDGNDGVLFAELGVDIDQGVGGDCLLVEDVAFAFLVVELAGSCIECDGDLLARLVAGFLDGADDAPDDWMVGRPLVDSRGRTCSHCCSRVSDSRGKASTRVLRACVSRCCWCCWECHSATG